MTHICKEQSCNFLIILPVTFFFWRPCTEFQDFFFFSTCLLFLSLIPVKLKIFKEINLLQKKKKKKDKKQKNEDFKEAKTSWLRNHFFIYYFIFIWHFMLECKFEQFLYNIYLHFSKIYFLFIYAYVCRYFHWGATPCQGSLQGPSIHQNKRGSCWSASWWWVQPLQEQGVLLTANLYCSLPPCSLVSF